MKNLIIIVLIILASIYPLCADDGGSQDEGYIETMVAASVNYWNRNFETLKENAVYSKLISQFGDANVVVTIAPTGEIVGIDFEDGKIVDYEVGGEILDSKIEVNLQMSTFRNVFYAADPTTAFLAAYKNDEIELIGRTASIRLLLAVTDKLKALIPSDSSSEGIISEDTREPAPTIEEEEGITLPKTTGEHIEEDTRGPAPTIEEEAQTTSPETGGEHIEENDKLAKNNFLSSFSKFIAGILGLFGR